MRRIFNRHAHQLVTLFFFIHKHRVLKDWISLPWPPEVRTAVSGVFRQGLAVSMLTVLLARDPPNTAS